MRASCDPDIRVTNGKQTPDTPQDARELAPWLKGFERSALNYPRTLEPTEDSQINHLLLELKQLSVSSLAPLLMVVLDSVDDLDRLEQILTTIVIVLVVVLVLDFGSEVASKMWTAVSLCPEGTLGLSLGF
jgi:hypothetical protein